MRWWALLRMVLPFDSASRNTRHYPRFVGLMEEVLDRGVVHDQGKPLITLEPGSMAEALAGGPPVGSSSRRRAPPRTRGTCGGATRTPLASSRASPRGDFPPEAGTLATEVISLHPAALQA